MDLRKRYLKKLAINQVSETQKNIMQMQMVEGESLKELEKKLQSDLNSKGLKTIGIFLGFFVLSSMIVILISILLSPEEEQNSITISDQPTNIITRNYAYGRVYHNSYVLNNFYDDYTLSIYYDSTIAVLRANKNTTDFVATLLKKKEQKVSKNGTTTTSDFSTTNPFLNILQTGENNDSQIDSNSSQMEIPSQTNGTQKLEELPNVLPIYRFSIYFNGSVASYTFPTELERQFVGLFRSITKLFSPLIDSKAYTGQMSIFKRKLKYGNYVQSYVGNGVGVDTNNSTNNTTPDQKYEETNGYNFQSTGDGVVLDTSGEVASSGPTHNTNQVKSQKNQFDENGQLVKGSQTSNTQFNSVKQEPDPNSSVMNFNMNYSSYQTTEMNLIISFIAQTSNIKIIQALILNYQDQNLTYTTDSTGIVDYVLGTNQEAEANETSRLLLQTDGSVSLLKFDSESKMFSTNVLGCQLQSSGYSYIGINLYKVPRKKYRKTIKFIAEKGIMIKIGAKQHKFPLIQYTKQLASLSTKFTLKKIESAVDFIKGDFLTAVKDIWDLASSDQFNSNFIPNIVNFLTLVRDIREALIQSENQNKPVKIVEDVASLINQISSIINNQKVSLIDPKKLFIENLSFQLETFVNQSYEDALGIFNSAKSNVQKFKDQGTDFLSESFNNFTQTDITIIQENIKNIIPPELYNEYLQQIKKAKPILDLIQVVKNNGTNYLNYVSESFITQKEDFLKFVKGIVDLFFANQTLITDLAYKNILDRFNSVEEELNYFRQMVNNFNINQTNKKTIYLFNTIIMEEFEDNRSMESWNSKIQNLKSSANWVSATKGPSCCQWHQAEWFQFWLDDGYCVRQNKIYSKRQAEPEVIRGLTTSWTSLFQMYTEYPLGYISDIKTIISNSSMQVDQKYYNIQMKYDQLSQIVKTQGIWDLHKQIFDKCSDVLMTYEELICGESIPLYVEKESLRFLYVFIEDYIVLFNKLKQNTQSVLKTFSPEVYKNIVNNFVISVNVKNFFESYKQIEQETNSKISDLNSIVINYSPQQFANSTSVGDQVEKLHEKISQSLGALCNSSQDQNYSIQTIRQQYQSRLELVNNNSNSFLQRQLNQTINFLNITSKTIYDSFLAIPFCQQYETFTEKIKSLRSDLINFKIIYALYKNMVSIIDRNSLSLVNIRNQIEMLNTKFYKLFTPDSFEQFVNFTQNLAQITKDLVYNISIDYSHLKQQSRQIQAFQMAPSFNLSEALQQFTTSPFFLKPASMFEDLDLYVSSAHKVVNLLSFDIITIVVISKDALQYEQSVISIYKNGTSVFSDKFSKLCQYFIDLSESSAQSYINEINQNFLAIIHTLNDTLFPNVSQKLNELQSRYQKYPFLNFNYQQIKNNCYNQLSNFVSITEQTKVNIFNKMNEIIENIKSITGKMQIGSLNSIYRLGVDMRNQFQTLTQLFPKVSEQINDFRNEILTNPRKLFQIQSFLSKLKRDVEEKYNQTVFTINSRVNQTTNYFNQNELNITSNIKSKFTSSEVFSKLDLVQGNLVLQFSIFWDEVKKKEDQIKLLVDSIPQDLFELINILGQAKDEFLDINQRVEQRIENIKDEFNKVKNKLTNIRSLIFITLVADFQGNIMGALNNIINETDNIVNQDIVGFQNIQNSILRQKFPLIDRTVTAAISVYKTLIPIRDKIVEGIDSCLQKIDQFLADNIAISMQKLKEGALELKSANEQAEEDDPQTVVLFQKELYGVEVPLYKYKQPILTQAGIFMITFGINFTLDINATVELRDYRSVDFRIIFEPSLLLNVRFGYSVAYILQVGIFVDGNVLRAQLNPVLQMNNIIPIQLIQAIASLPQITQDNVVKINFAIDLEIYAVELKVGFYISHLWLKMQWYDKQICVFPSLCVIIKIPIRLKVFSMVHDFGYKFKGVQIVKKRILNLQLLSWKYD